MARTKQGIGRMAKIADTEANLGISLGNEANAPKSRNALSLPSTEISNTLTGESFQLVALAPVQAKSSGLFLVTVSGIFTPGGEGGSTVSMSCGQAVGTAAFSATGGTVVDDVYIATTSGTPLTIAGGGSVSESFPGLGEDTSAAGSALTLTWAGLFPVVSVGAYMAATISVESSAGNV
jgi:hypothetical protein